jgi:ribosomal-protein-alanine N-acetyltransferase
MLGEAAEIEKLCFSEPWSPEALLYMCKSPNTHAVAVIIEGRLAAYGGCEFVPPEANIVNIATHPDFRRRGCAAAVIDSLEEFLSSKGVDSIFLEVRASNAPARALYEGKGFAVVGVRKNYYRFPTEDAEVMLKTIS